MSTRRRGTRARREAALGYLLLAPALVVFGVFVFYPFAHNVYLGFFRAAPFPGLPNRYVGLRQYGDVLGSDAFLRSLKTTVLFVAMTVPTGLVLGLGLALVAHQRLRGIKVYRTIFSSTVVTSVAVASVIFGTLLNPHVGLLPSLGISPDPPILGNPGWALPAVALVTVWQNLGLSFILMSSGLQAIPEELLEAAAVDGAGSWVRLTRITIPLLGPVVLFAVVVGSILSFQSFGQIDLLTRGGPLGGTNVLTYFIFTELRLRNDPGTAAVLSVALFLVTLGFTALQIRLIERRVTYAR